MTLVRALCCDTVAATRQKHQMLLCEIKLSHPHAASRTVKTNAKVLGV